MAVQHNMIKSFFHPAPEGPVAPAFFGGDTYHFDPSVIATLRMALQEDLQRRLRLTILFYASPDVPDSCMCPDERQHLQPSSCWAR